MSDSVKISGNVKRSANSAHCHVMVADVAKAAAHELYDALMFDNMLNELWRKRFPNLGPKKLEAKFVSMFWGKCIPFARATLAQLLRSPIDDRQKESIVEALALDATLIRGRTGAESAMPPSLRELLH